MVATEGFLSPTITNHAIDTARADTASAREAGAMDAALARVRTKQLLAEKEAELFEAKKALHGQLAIRNALKAALAEIAPDHELNNPEVRARIREEAEAKTQPDDPWFPS
jgi:hypothetical protein